jgi:hypothetical protein
LATYQVRMADFECETLIGTNRPFAVGSCREVFDVIGDRSVVMKKQLITFPGCNMLEWFIWNAISSSPLGDVFGKCHAISETGRYLIMERLNTLTPVDLPVTVNIPMWFTDRKGSGFGKDANGNTKIRDYSLLKLGMALNTGTAPFTIT